MKKSKKTSLPTSGRIGRIARILVSEVGESRARKIMKGAETFNQLSQPLKAEYIKNMIKRMKQIIGVPKTYQLLVSCGQKCCGVSTRKKATEIFKKSKSLKEFINLLNKQGIGGGRLKMKDKTTITGGYDRCYCGMVSKTRSPFTDTTYCTCSTGWYKQLFETALGRPVEVKILQSIVAGAETCEFIIKLKE